MVIFPFPSSLRFLFLFLSMDIPNELVFCLLFAGEAIFCATHNKPPDTASSYGHDGRMI